ncbi:hypothetical protein [Paenibacillus timonensis]|uniref:hypothetical protein n=1 Tax=Paenibacillus timonensis TaxID=225915 RepID=UPI003F9C9E73
MLPLIQRLTVVSNQTRIFEVGTEIDGREIIEIVPYGGETYLGYSVFDENGHLIASVENCPVIVDWKTIAVHDEKENDLQEQVASGA